MARLLQNKENTTRNESNYHSNYSTVLHNDTSEQRNSDLMRSRSGNISCLGSNSQSRRTKFSKLEEILERPRNPNFDKKQHKLMFRHH